MSSTLQDSGMANTTVSQGPLVEEIGRDGSYEPGCASAQHVPPKDLTSSLVSEEV